MPIEPAKHECLVRCHPAFGWRAKSTTQSLGGDRHSRTPVSATKANSKFRLGRAQRVPPSKDVKSLEHQLLRQPRSAQAITLLPRRFPPKRKLGAAPESIRWPAHGVRELQLQAREYSGWQPRPTRPKLVGQA